VTTPTSPSGAPGRRDRHGKGMRGPLAPREVPLSRSRSERFDELVLDAVESAERAARGDVALLERLGEVEIGVEDIPPETVLAVAESRGEQVPLGRCEPGTPARVVIYRRPVELRAKDALGRAALVHAIVVERLAELLGVPTETLEDDEGPDEELPPS